MTGYVVFHNYGAVAHLALDATSPAEAAASAAETWGEMVPCSPEDAAYLIEPLTGVIPDQNVGEDDLDYSMRIPTDETKRTWWGWEVISG